MWKNVIIHWISIYGHPHTPGFLLNSAQPSSASTNGLPHFNGNNTPSPNVATPAPTTQVQ